MIQLSLRLRSFAAALLALLVFIPLTALTLEQAFSNSLSQAMLEQLRLQSLNLISEFEMDGDAPQMPEQLFNDPLNIPGSGLYAFIKQNDESVWHSLSTLNWLQQPVLVPPSVGEESFDADYSLNRDYFLFAYTAEFETSQGYTPFSFYILQDKRTFDNENRHFANTLWKWLGLIAVLLLALLLFSLNAALHPINKLIEQIRQAENGQLDRIEQPYPPELEKLKSSINHLLDTEQQQRSRYKNSLSDLAHALKTPLAVLAGTANMPPESRDPLLQINNQIQRQLKRAVAGGGSGWELAEAVKPVAEKLLGAMKKVYADKELKFTLQAEDDCHFHGDLTDLMELLGNLLDNGCKAAKSKLQLSIRQNSVSLIICIEDDGPGIAFEHRQSLLSRGTRLDSYQEGQGIGMAVVSDLVAAYQGQLQIDDSPLGGAKISVTFPISDKKYF
jgi:two-component system sensor histidine kinase PhoQ